MEELREQPTMEPANTLNKVNDERAVSDVGSQGQLGKFKDVTALLNAYNNLEAEFTRKCQLLKSIQKEKIDESENIDNLQNNDNLQANDTNLMKNDEKIANNQEKNVENNKLIKSFEEIQEDNNQNDYLQSFNQFLDENEQAKEYADEIKKYLDGQRIKNPYEDAWANVILNHIKVRQSDPLISQYVQNNEEVKNKIIENYLNDLKSQKPPYIISSQGGQRVSGVLPDSPKTLADAKKILNNMFS